MALLLLLLMAAPSVTNAGVTCGQVLSYLTPCISYAMGRGSEPPAACCSGVSNLNAAANNTADRQATCKCLKQITQQVRRRHPIPNRTLYRLRQVITIYALSVIKSQ